MRILASTRLDPHARARVVAAAEAAPTAQAMFAAVSANLSEVVPFVSSGWFGVDPLSLLPSWPARIENVERGHCNAYWELEFLEDDALQLRSLLVGPRTTGALHRELDGLMMRSARYRGFLAPRGYGDELRSALRTGDSAWGLVALLRRDDSPPFSDDEIGFVASLSQPLAEALRTKVIAGQPAPPGGAGPGVLSFDLNGGLVAANDAAIHWLDQLPNNALAGETPVAVSTALAHVRAVEAGRARGSADIRLPSRTGEWLTVRASALRAVSGEAQAFAVTIEPADRNGLAPMLAEAYGLSRRELEVANRLAKGESTAAIAESLYLSEHTVRDHVKAILAKMGVSSRAALVARLFFDHAPREREVEHA